MSHKAGAQHNGTHCNNPSQGTCTEDTSKQGADADKGTSTEDGAEGISEGTKELEEEATVVKAEAAEAAKDVTPTPGKDATPAPDKDKV